ncbi:AI-2E family transporter [Pseudahrensia aquimaris]|uniref:AI-2E family transporter n=1 Tax=Pseudahrensia aquimaris TaxID=744461 RepID=A0ABW3FCW2_9HYPH
MAISEQDKPLLTPGMRRQLIFWLLSAVIFLLMLVLLRSILLPFIAGMALAYFLDPVADKLETWGASRLLATSIILLLFIILFVLAFLLIIPSLSQQFAGFVERMPGYVAQLQALLVESELLKRIIGEGGSTIRDNLDSIVGKGTQWASTVLASIWSSGKAIIDVVSLLVITPIVAFYLLLDWDRMIARVDSWLPRDHKQTIRQLARDMNGAIAGFVRGQGSVCLILGTFYALALTVVGLNFGLLIGMFVGLISFIPFVGSIIGLVLSVGVALVQFWPEWPMVLIVIGVFAVGQFVEGNFLQPRLVGKSVGLHPVWLMFALSAFGALFGFTGLLVAVPVAAALGVLVRFALQTYLESPLYKGHNGESDTKPSKKAAE